LPIPDLEDHSEDALANSPLDPIANFAFGDEIADRDTPSDAPGTPISPSEIELDKNHLDKGAIELEEVNWELFKTARINYFRPLIGKSHFFQPRLLSDFEENPVKSPFLLRTPESDNEIDIYSSNILAEKIFNHLVDEIVLETAFQITGAILEEKIESSKGKGLENNF
jgi:hypothetical protein